MQCVHHLKLGEFALLTLSKKSSSPTLFPLTPLYFFHGIYPYQYSCPIIHFLKPSDYHGGGGDGQFASVVTSCREGNGTPLQDSCLENPMDGGAWKAAVHGVAKTERLHFHFSLSCIGEGNGNPLQCSCLENPRDGGAWWAAVYGVAQCRT